MTPASKKSWKHYFRTLIKYSATPYVPQFDDLILTGQELNVAKGICSELPFRRSLKTDEVLAPLRLLLKQNIVMVSLKMLMSSLIRSTTCRRRECRRD